MRNIYFFGGYLATQADVNAWKVSALLQTIFTNIKVFPWPNHASSSDPLATFKGSREIAHEVELLDHETYIVGHSSGCAIANEVASLLSHPVNLVCLDGFVPYRTQRPLPTTQIWSAASASHGLSRNYQNLKTYPNFHVYVSKCTQVWPLHFSLVNENVDDTTTILRGYLNCKANLCWLKEEQANGNIQTV